MSIRFFACRDVVELATDYVERALPTDELERFELHLTMCGACVEYLDQMRESIEHLRELDDRTVEPDLMERLLATFREWQG
jgi:predicted anti-sigma-YlaC factor YlaD